MTKSPVPLGERPLFRRLFLVFIILAGLAAVVTTFYGKRLRAAYHQRQGAMHAAAAMQAFDKGDFDEALSRASNAWRHAPEATSTIRVLANLISLNPAASKQSVSLWTRLLKSGEATDEDRLNAARAFLVIGDSDLAQSALSGIGPESATSQKLAEIRAAILREQGKNVEANMTIANLIEASGKSEDPDLQLNGALIDLSSLTSFTKDKSLQKLLQLAELKDDTGLKAIDALCDQLDRLTVAEKSRLRDLIVTHPMAGDNLQLMAVSLEIQIHPNQRAEILKREVQTRLNQPIDKLTNFFAWMIDEHEDEMTLKLLSFDQAVKSDAIFPHYLTALIRTGRWNELERVLNSDKYLPIRETQIQLTRCILAAEKGAEDGEIESKIRSLYRLCQTTPDPKILMIAAQFAEKNGFQKIATEGYRLLLKAPAFKLPALEALYDFARKTNSYDGLLEVADIAATDYSANKTAAAQLAYLRLLGGRDMELTTPTVLPLVRKNRTDFDNVLLALYYYRIHMPEKMAAFLDKITPKKLNPGPRCVYAGLLQRNNRTVEAYRVFEKVPKSLTITQERDFFRTPQ